MPQHGWYERGQWNFVCDQCGLVFKSGQGSLRWDGAMVDWKCWEPRHPQDFVRGIPDNQATPWSRPRTFLFTGETTPDDELGSVTIGDGPALGGP